MSDFFDQLPTVDEQKKVIVVSKTTENYLVLTNKDTLKAVSFKDFNELLGGEKVLKEWENISQVIYLDNSNRIAKITPLEKHSMSQPTKVGCRFSKNNSI